MKLKGKCLRDHRWTILLRLWLTWRTYYEQPSGELVMVGVTGTIGKTTIATLLYRLYTLLGYKCGLLSTIENQIGDQSESTMYTTPDAMTIQETFIKRWLKQDVRMLSWK
jgi:UDP-N-acetylmuramoyl-L-alanyl-D-glutamate--2,6-diaminopimelate ligase